MNKMKNKEMDELLVGLTGLMDKAQGKLGYAIAKNYRIISNELKEYLGLKDQAIAKFGEPDENGRVRILIGTESYKNYLEEMKQYDDIESEINIVMVSPDDVYSSDLTAKEISGLLFMIKEDNNEA